MDSEQNSGARPILFARTPKLVQMRDPLSSTWNQNLANQQNAKNRASLTDDETINLAQLVDFSQLNNIFANYLEVVGLPVSIIDFEGRVLASSKWQRICMEFHRTNPETFQHCLESDTCLSRQIQEGKGYAIYRCPNGLTDCASPIIIEGQHIANLFIGQFFLQPPDMQEFAARCAEFGFDQEAYFQALQEVPIVAEEKVPTILNLLVGLAHQIAGQSLAEHRLKTAYQSVEGQVQERTLELAEKERKYRNLFENAPVGIFHCDPEGRFVTANPALAKMLNYASPEELISATAGMAFQVYADPGAGPQVLEDLLKTDGWIHREAVLWRRKDGSLITVAMTGRKVLNGAGEVEYLESFIEDITGRKRVEEALRQSEENFRFMMESSSDVIWHMNAQYCFDYISPADEHLRGFTREEVLGKPLWALLKPEGIDHIKKANAQRLLDEKNGLKTGAIRYELEENCKDGSWIWMEVNVQPQRDERGNLIGYHGVSRDITERKQVEESLRETNAYLENLINYANAPIIVWDPQFRITRFNHAFEFLTGHSEANVIGQSLEMLFPPELAEQSMGQIRKTLTGERWETVEIKILHRAGSVRTVLWNSATLFAPDGKTPLATIAQGQDITERKQAEEAVQAAEARYARAVRGTSDGLWDWNILTGEDYHSPRYMELLGYAENEFGNTLEDFERLIHPDDLSAVRAAQQAHLQTGALYDIELRMRTKPGEYRWFRARGQAERDARGRALNMAGSVTDITDQKRAQEALLVAKEQAEAANRAKSIFLANMSHELRTPLNAILGFSQLMAHETNLTASQRDNLNIINRSGEHLLHLINDVLDMAKIESGRHTYQAAPLDIQHLLKDLGAMFRLRAENRGLALLVECEPNIPNLVVSDEPKLRQVLINLLGNAIKFTDSGQVTLQVCTRAEPAPVLIFNVQDTGSGISPSDLEVIFQPFIQSATPDKTREGTGLGLSISHEFALLMGGELSAASPGIPGLGSVFTLKIPLLAADEAEMADKPKQPRAHAVHLQKGQPAFRLLVAEDRSENSALLVTLLTQLGFEVQAAANGRLALDLWREWQPHLIWMDLRMPKMDGIEATQQIRRACQKDPALARPVIVALSASVFGEAQAQVITAGCDAFVAKPFRQNELVEILEKHLGARFIYEDLGHEQNQAPQIGLQTDKLDPELRARLRQAAIAANSSRLKGIITQILPRQPDLAGQLLAWVDAFEYDQIVALLDKANPG